MDTAVLERAVQTRLNEFYERRIAKLATLDLKKTLRRKSKLLVFNSGVKK